MARAKLKSDLQNFTILHNEFIETEILSGNEKLVFMAIRRHMNSENKTAFPSLTKIAKYSRLCKSTVQKTLKMLENKGIIKIEHRQTKEKGNTSNLYTIYDYKSIWTVGNSKEIKQAIKLEQEQEAITLLESRGYTVRKEKELVSESEQTTDTSTKSTDRLNKNIIFEPKSQAKKERYTLENIRNLYDYESLLIQHSAEQKDIDIVFDILYDTLNSTKETIRIGSEDKPAMAVIGKLMKLEPEDIFYSIQMFHEQTGRIKNVKGYLLTILYHAKEQRHLDLINLGHHNQDF